MKTVSSLINNEWYGRYKMISKLNIRSSIYDITNKCNLSCRGCFYFSSNQMIPEEENLEKWNRFIDNEVKRGINLAILIGGEPTMFLDRLESFFNRIPTLCTTNGLIKVPRDRFENMIIAISTWGSEEKKLRGMDTFAVSSKNYANDSAAYYIYSVSPENILDIETMIIKVRDIGLKIHIQLLCSNNKNDEYDWSSEKLKDIRTILDEMLDKYPETYISTKYFNRVLTSRKMLERIFGHDECPSITQPLDKRKPVPKRLPNFVRWAPDLTTMRHCCVANVRDCNQCNDGAAIMSWIMVNKRAHMRSRVDFQNWIEVVEMFQKLNGLT